MFTAWWDSYPTEPQVINFDCDIKSPRDLVDHANKTIDEYTGNTGEYFVGDTFEDKYPVIEVEPGIYRGEFPFGRLTSYVYVGKTEKEVHDAAWNDYNNQF